MDWESWLRAAANPPSDNEDSKRDKIEQRIKTALANHSPLDGKKYRVYAKGSYANNTNVRLNYDVDIAVEYYGYFFSDLMFDLAGQDQSVVGVTNSTDPYKVSQFKTDVRDALVTEFGANLVLTGKIAYRVPATSSTLPADIVPCWEYRRYTKIESGVPIYTPGSRIFPSSGSLKNNFPDQQKENGVEKNNVTGYRYKYMVRALKRLQTYMIDQKIVTTELPSYLVECLVFNVSNDGFGHDAYLADMRYILARIFNATLDAGDWNDWIEVNRLKYLLRVPDQWSREQVHAFASKAWITLGLA